MTTSYSKIRGRSKGYRYRNSIVDLQRDLQRANAKNTKEEFSDVTEILYNYSIF